jgi:endonuclease/exonuclease/phosphatase family metal-dependent hydrolase
VTRVQRRVRRLAHSLLATCLVLAGCATAQRDATPPVQSYPVDAGAVAQPAGRHDGRLRLMTLNIAHGRGAGFHQLLQRTTTTLANLDHIATLLRHSGADVVALQETDGPSFWSGNFSHLDYLARNGAYHRAVHGAHVHGLGLSYGTALMARFDLREPRAITFDPALSPVPKGFVVSTIDWPARPGVEVDVVSLHLDFSSEVTRRQQAQEVIRVLQDSPRPRIIMGDFNIGWHAHSTVRRICQALGLTAYRPEAPGLETFPAFGERLDWILISPGIAFRSYRVIPDSVSDHRGVLAELELLYDPPTRVARHGSGAWRSRE